MHDLLIFIHNTSNHLSEVYNLDPRVLFILYLVSLPPFYGGYLLMAYGTTRHLNFSDIIRLKFTAKLRWHPLATLGLWVHLFGRALPYVYILVFAKSLPVWVFILISILFISSISFILYKLLKNTFKDDAFSELNIERLTSIHEKDLQDTLWSIYGKTFAKLNRESPCKQSYSEEHFYSVLREKTVNKYVLKLSTGEVAGIALITNNLANAEWISSEYFQTNYPKEYSAKSIYYFLGLAIDSKFRSKRLSLPLIEHIIDDIPHDSIMAFDHSKNVNPFLHHFTKVVRQAKKLRSVHIEQQHYHIVKRR